MTDKYRGLLALLIATFVGATMTPTLVRTGVETIPTVWFSALRGLLTFFLFAPLLRTELKILFSRKFLPHLLIMGATIGGNTLLFSLGVPHTTLTVSQLMYAMLPLTVPLVAYVILGEIVSPRKALGAFLALSGVLILTYFSQQASARMSLGTLYGNALIFLAVACYSLYLVYSKKNTVLYSPFLLSAASYLGTAIWLGLLSIVQYLWQPVVVEISSRSLIALGLLGIVSCVHMGCLQYGLKRVSSMTTAIVTLLAPEFAAISGWFIYGERPSFILFISMCLVFSGVLLSLMSERLVWWQRVFKRN